MKKRVRNKIRKNATLIIDISLIPDGFNIDDRKFEIGLPKR